MEDSPPDTGDTSFSAAGPVKRKRNRKIASCLPCHSRKVKCNQERPVCSICAKRNKAQDCKWEDGGRYVPRPVPPPDPAKSTFLNVGTNIECVPLTPPPVRPLVSGTAKADFRGSFGSLLAEAAASTDAMIPLNGKGITRDFLNTSSESEPVLHISENSAIGYCRSLLSLNDFSLHEMKNVSLLTDAPSNGNGSQDIVLPFFSLQFDSPMEIQSLINEFGIELPSRPKIDELVSNYLTHVNALHPIWDSAEVRQLTSDLLDTLKGDVKTRQFAAVNVLLFLAQGSRFCLDREEVKRGTEFAKCARRKLLDLGSPVSPLGITAHFLLALYLQESHEYALSFIYLGSAIRSAQLLGYHLLIPSNKYQKLWQCLTRVELAHAFLAGRPSLLTPLFVFDPLSTTSINFYDPYDALCTFTTFLSQATELLNSYPTNLTSFRLLSNRIKSFSPLMTTAEIFQNDLNLLPSSSASPSSSTARPDGVTPCIRLYYVVFTRLILIAILSPFINKPTAPTTDTEKEIEQEALEEAHDLIGAASTLHELFPAFIKCSDLVLLGVMAATLVCSVHTLRHPVGELADRSKLDIMRAQLIFFACRDTEPLAARGCDVIQRLRRRYYDQEGPTPRNGTPPAMPVQAPVPLLPNGHLGPFDIPHVAPMLGGALGRSRSPTPSASLPLFPSSSAFPRLLTSGSSAVFDSKEKNVFWNFDPALPLPALDDLMFDWDDAKWLDWLHAADPTSIT